MDEGNQNLLRNLSNNMLEHITDKNKAEAVIPFLTNLLEQVQQQVQIMAPSQTYPMMQPIITDQMAPQGFSLNGEKIRVAVRLAGFDAKESPVVQDINRRFGSDIKQGELVNIAAIIAENAGIKLDRDAKRRKSVLLKWFDENWTKIQPYLDYIVLEDENTK
ncbi:hypothetical protein GPJ56_009650 [Histomonas meleagridis]|uniref:uncharacterized protein n=1 Tax=Histomonas meleagridis TaxID=135588 RepID=UPI00355A4C92|nr:hypothetical protein GPJ56_009650 [Histomonas meleagridis]KAH0804389.1 hypothetical protein GO595_003219 [Histomonas meleagridis]